MGQNPKRHKKALISMSECKSYAILSVCFPFLYRSIESRFNIEMSIKELTFLFSFELALHFYGFESVH